MSAVDKQRDPALDQALSTYLDSGSEENLEALLHFGPAAFSRVFELSYRGHDADVPRLNPAPRVAGREAIDAWSSVLSRLAREFPDRFFDALDALEPQPVLSVMEVVIVAGIPGRRATKWLQPFAASADWLLRYHAVRGLGSRNDELAIGVVEDRLADSDPSVHFAAIRGLAWRDRGRAEQLLRQMVNDVTTPALLRQQAKEELEALAPP